MAKRGQKNKGGDLDEAAASASPSNITHPKPLVFISHDSRDADLAEAFANLLLDVSAGTMKSFRASDKKGTSGIEFGTEWYNAIMSRLSEATDVVALLTQRSIDRPWILYEAGVAKGKLDTNVLGIALGVPLEKVSIGPFGQFQNCGDDEDSLTKLVMQLLKRNPDAAPREEAIKALVKVFKQKATELLEARQESLPLLDQAAGDSGVAKLFEEVKVMVRDLPLRLRPAGPAFSRGFRVRGRRRAVLLDEIWSDRRLRTVEDGAAAWMLTISLFQDDLPFVYGLGMEVYRALVSRDSRHLQRAMRSFTVTIEAVLHGKFTSHLHRLEAEDIIPILHHLGTISHDLVHRSRMERTAKIEASLAKTEDREAREAGAGDAKSGGGTA